MRAWRSFAETRSSRWRPSGFPRGRDRGSRPKECRSRKTPQLAANKDFVQNNPAGETWLAARPDGCRRPADTHRFPPGS